MFIRYSQSGGFAGHSKSLEIETTSLPPADANDLNKLIEDSCWRDFNASAVKSFPDAQYYEVELKDDRDEKRFAFSDGGIPKSFRGLITWLREHSSYEKS